MSDSPQDDAAPTSPGAPLRPLGRPLFIATIGLSSFTLFALELLAGRLVLPIFGGTPSVWTTALCFFTAVVFSGYAYAHLIATRFGQRSGGVLHLLFAAAVIAATALAPADLTALRHPGIPAAIDVLLALGLIAGAPALLFAATTPLLSAWFSQRGRDPWWLYAVSNGASLAGLLAYPFVIEPFMPLSAQRTALRVLVAILTALLAGVVAGAQRGAHGGRPVRTPRPALRRRFAWLFAAMIPAGLLSATTMHIATDQVSTPLLWVGPLGIYLGSFVLAFSRQGRRVLPIAEKLVPAAATIMWVPFIARVSWPAPVIVLVLLSAFGVLAIAIHGRLALSRPDETHLTGFYLVVSAGGLLATAFVALVAPVIFSDVHEYPLLIIGGLAALAMLPGPVWSPASGPGAALRNAALRLTPYLAMGALLLVSVSADAPDPAVFVAVVLAVGAQVVLVGRTPRALAIATSVALAVLLLLFSPTHLVRVRTFFGITQVREDKGGESLSEMHGTTLHGLQFKDERRIEPTSYFVRSGPLGDVFAELADRRPGAADIGVVGLGIGTIAAYERPGDAMTYFEVDQAVVDLALDRRYFTYLTDAPSPPQIVLGDGRLSLAARPGPTFDLLILDAFSSDSVPAHLLTREAIQTYLRTLKPGGLLVFQLTNRHFDLTPAVAETARTAGLDSRTLLFTAGDAESENLAAQSSRWLVVGQQGSMEWFDANGWEHAGGGPVLTDDYTSILQLMRWR